MLQLHVVEQTDEARKASDCSKTSNQYSHLLNPQYWLTDLDINHATNILKIQFPEVTFQDCLLIQRRCRFDAVVKHGFGYYAQVS